VPLIGILLLGLGCSGRHPGRFESPVENPVEAQKPVVQPAITQPARTTQEFPGLRVELALSQKAKTTLFKRKETIIVAGYLSGNPKQGALKQYVDQVGQVNLGTIKTEVAPGENATFGVIKLKQDVFAQTDQQAPELVINVYSGRKSSDKNLLDCTFYQGGLKLVQGQGRSIPISCKLIGE
jgi:hypothetical protein